MRYIGNRMVSKRAIHRLQQEGYYILAAEDVGIGEGGRIGDIQIARYAKGRGMTVITRNSDFVKNLTRDLKGVRVIFVPRSLEREEWYSYLKRIVSR
jgi:predicted nuclease of predicted toxin-antitoxin system